MRVQFPPSKSRPEIRQQDEREDTLCFRAQPTRIEDEEDVLIEVVGEVEVWVIPSGT
ncbi:hypothetical protein ACFQFH_14920 [Halobaculum halobium]|uniref:hypothetical protein n=1 Tax=Halobaculum halobium TaxID=3032281 RepID=UPI0036207405